MQRPEEDARQEGIRLLEVHVKLLREARAALYSQNLGAKNKLLEEIEKVEKKIEVWRKRYEDLYLQGNDLWSLVEEEEDLERKRKMDQKMKEEGEDRIREENPSKKLEEIKKRNLEKKHEIEAVKEKATESEKQRAMSGEPLTPAATLVKDIGGEKREQIINQEDSQLVKEDKEVKEALGPHESEGKDRKRQHEEEMEDGEQESVKRRKAGGADTPVARQSKSYRVLVQNISPSVQYTELRTYFSTFGAVSKVYLRSGTGSGYVIYESEAVVDLVCSLQHRLGEQDVRVMKDTVRHNPPAGPEPASPENAVFVFGVTPGTDAQALSSALASFGPVAKVSRPVGKSYAFVKFEKESGMEAAIKARKVPLNGGTLVIRPMKVSSEEGKTSREDGAAKEAAVVTSAKPKKGHQVFLCGLTIPMDLHGFQMGLAQFGRVVDAYMPEDKNYAFVGFDTEEAQQAAIKAGAVSLPGGRAIIRATTRR
ncbi:nucleolin-like [Eriocheir sinensis]|uniref:nucleolin-like n=1 Tax=Eriocheir sinensis TaxID=95602 RepID=UPI0021C841BD|nr:nucleolin-like [Eriocheir sinensis]XP_050700743.1 nucleolin-like [Eriocheir sinensis]